MKKTLNICNKCGKESSSSTNLVKINGVWFCFECISYNKNIFALLKKHGYTYNLLKPYVRFKIND